VFGPNQAGAQLESSKAFAKEVMRRAGVATAGSRTFSDLVPALAYIDTHAAPLVVKASGLAAGKGVVVCATRVEAARAARAMLEERAYGDAGREIVVEDFLDGEELSVFALTDGEHLAILPPAQDHKRLREGDAGPNTGGMGAYSPVSFATPALLTRVRREVLEPTLRELASRGISYQGVLYAGLMVAPEGTVRVLEFNCRFGDPEAQAVLPVLRRGATADLAAIATGGWRPSGDVMPAVGAAVTTVLAARGYPEHPETGAAIALPAELGPDVLVFHAGTTRDAQGTLRVSGGRVLAVTAHAATVVEAARTSAAACARIAFDGKAYRRDIGWREIARAGAA
jgi:phosphoribosylamine--glycine ligase